MSKGDETGDDPALESYIRFAGLKRCGNHVIANWLLSKFSGPVCYRNNAQKFGRLDDTSCDTIEALDSGEDRTPVDLQEEGSKRLFFVSYEDQPVEEVFDMRRVGKYSRFYQHRIASFYHVILIRDPYNYFASRIQSERNGDMRNDDRFSDPVGKHVLIYWWKRYAEWFLRFCGSFAPFEVGISYNRWLVDEDYRREICEQLGLKFDDSGFDTITGWGGGSSFTGRKYGDPSDFLSRWQEFENHAVFREIVADSEITELSGRIFGDVLKIHGR